MNCTANTKTGKQCKFPALKGSNLCFNHSPNVSDEAKHIARSNGGKASISQKYELTEIKINNSNDIFSLLTDTIQRVRTNKMDIRIANCIGYLSAHCIKILEVCEFEKRIEAIEKELKINNNTL